MTNNDCGNSSISNETQVLIVYDPDDFTDYQHICLNCGVSLDGDDHESQECWHCHFSLKEPPIKSNELEKKFEDCTKVKETHEWFRSDENTMQCRNCKQTAFRQITWTYADSGLEVNIKKQFPDPFKILDKQH